MTPEPLIQRALTSARVRLTRNVRLNAFRSHLAEPMVSFSFDDAPRSAFTEGGRVLRDMGWTGTYYVAGSFCGRRVDGIDYMDRDDLIQADQEGHEIGCHTFSHLRLSVSSAKAIHDDLRRNEDFIREVLPQHKLSSFAYPFGDLDLRSKALLARKFPICRGIWEGVNQGRMDFAQLKSVRLERRSYEPRAIEFWLDRAVAAKGWLIFFTHDISDDPSPFGCSRDVFAKVAESVARRGIRVLPVKNVAGLAAAPLDAIQ